VQNRETATHLKTNSENKLRVYKMKTAYSFQLLTINGEINILATKTTELLSAKPRPAMMLNNTQ